MWHVYLFIYYLLNNNFFLHQVEPSQCIMIGDRIETDIVGGKNAGFALNIWLKLDESENSDIPNYVIREIDDFPKVFQEIISHQCSK